MKTQTDIDHGKYSIVHYDGRDLCLLRNGEFWLSSQTSPTFPAKMLLAASAEIETLRADKSGLCTATDAILADKAKLTEYLGKELANVITLKAEILMLREILKRG